MNWNDERVELLKKLWQDGLSASQIAAQLGGVSRNAVIGKVHRLKLSARQSRAVSRPMAATVGANALKIQYDADALPQYHVRPVQENVVVPMSRRLKLVELTEHTCKWPNGDPLAEDFSFCGNDSAETGPYCQYHARLAFQPASERRRR